MSECEENNDAGVTKRNKRQFNKKKWFEQKYSCKAKVKKWDNLKRKQAQRQLEKELKKSKVNHKLIENDSKPAGNKSLSRLKQAEMRYAEIQRIKEENRKEQERIKKERIEAIKAYKAKKAEKFKKISQKTRKGQPLMRGRIELLLEEIQKKFVNQDG